MPNSSWIGVAIACGGNVLISLGLWVLHGLPYTAREPSVTYWCCVRFSINSNSQKLAHQRLESQVQSIRNAPLEAIKVNSSDQLDSATSSIRRRTSRQHSNPASPLWSPNGLAPLPVIRSLDAEHGDQIIGTTSTQQDARHGRHEATLAEEFEEQSGGWNVHAENGLSVSPIQEVTEEEEADQGEMGNGEGEREGYLKSPLWWGGLALCAVGEAGNFLSYGFAPASVVAPLGTVGELQTRWMACIRKLSLLCSSGGQLLPEPYYAWRALKMARPAGCTPCHRGSCDGGDLSERF
jgi:hypothetical protein